MVGTLETRAEQELRRVERPRRDDDRARAHRVPLTCAVDELDARRLSALEEHALDGRVRA